MKIDESHDYANFPTEEDPTQETQSENSETFNESGDDNILVAENFEIWCSIFNLLYLSFSYTAYTKLFMYLHNMFFDVIILTLNACVSG